MKLTGPGRSSLRTPACDRSTARPTADATRRSSATKNATSYGILLGEQQPRQAVAAVPARSEQALTPTAVRNCPHCEQPVTIVALLVRPGHLPPPEVRARLRKADGLTQQDVAQVFEATRVAFNRWEVGTAKPRRRHLEAYACSLLAGWAAKHPAAADTNEAE
ncbi:hypothetical protein LV779_35920 [Streptomyces thinghirensis]|nr:hypothetical protein [Streptomyces thinghirensis]